MQKVMSSAQCMQHWNNLTRMVEHACMVTCLMTSRPLWLIWLQISDWRKSQAIQNMFALVLLTAIQWVGRNAMACNSYNVITRCYIFGIRLWVLASTHWLYWITLNLACQYVLSYWAHSSTRNKTQTVPYTADCLSSYFVGHYGSAKLIVMI